MTLVPVRDPFTGLLRDMARLDPDGTSELVRIALYESLADDIDRYGDGIRAQVAKQLERTTTATRRALVRSFVAKRERGEDVEEELAAAAYLAAADHSISKAWDPRRHPRNAKGQFVHELTGRNSYELATDAHESVTGMINSGFLREGSEVNLHGERLQQGRPTGQPGKARITATQNSHDLERQIDEAEVIPRRLVIAPNQTNANLEGHHGTVFDLASRLTGPGFGTKASHAAPVDSPEQLNSALTTVMRDSNGTDRRSYRRMAATGQALQRLSTPGSNTHAIGGVARLVGEMGPEAENVLGRPIKRTAYRYRGTERKPNKMLVEEVDNVTASADDVAAASKSPALRAEFAQDFSRSSGLSMGTMGYYAGTHVSVGGGGPRGEGRAPGTVRAEQPGIIERGVDPDSDQLDMRLRGDTAAGYFLRKIPSAEQSELSIEAGRVPPSQGAIIDSRGQVAAEAMGYGEDHYLPFDLKNLKALHGGQYVRTRAAGGPTTEDIYTGLLTGARQLQVVSNSGVFTVEFDPDLRGGRRYSDKARQMVGRYQALLDRIDRNAGAPDQLMAQDIPDEQKTQLRQDAYTAAGFDESDGRKMYQAALKRARVRAQFAGPTEEQLDSQAEEQAIAEAEQSGAHPSRPQLLARQKEIKRELSAQAAEQRVHMLRLDGVGYARALSSLQQEFPYFIRSVDYETTAEFDQRRRHSPPNRPLPAPDASRRTRDKGYLGGGKISSSDNRPPDSSPSDQVRGTDSQGRPVRPPTQDSEQARTAQRARASGAGELATLGFQAPQGGKLSDLAGQREDMARHAVDQLSGLGNLGYVSGVAIPSKEEMAGDPTELQHNPSAFFTAVTGDPQQSRARLAEAMKPENKLQRRQLAEGLREHDSQLEARANAGYDPPGEAARQQIPSERTKAALESLQRLDAADQPFAEPAEDPALYSPEGDDAPPQRFDALDALGTDQDNYERFIEHLEQNKARAPFLYQGLQRLSQMNDVQQRQTVRDEVRTFTNTVNWGKAPLGDDTQPPRPVGQVLVSDWGKAREIAANPQTSQQYKQLLGMQQAWSLLHGLNIASQVGGDAGPKAPEASGPAYPQMPQFRDGSTTPEQVEQRNREQGFGKSDRPKVIVHPPGSAVAKALASKRATSLRPVVRRR